MRDTPVNWREMIKVPYSACKKDFGAAKVPSMGKTFRWEILKTFGKFKNPRKKASSRQKLQR